MGIKDIFSRIFKKDKKLMLNAGDDNKEVIRVIQSIRSDEDVKQAFSYMRYKKGEIELKEVSEGRFTTEQLEEMCKNSMTIKTAYQMMINRTFRNKIKNELPEITENDSRVQGIEKYVLVSINSRRQRAQKQIIDELPSDSNISFGNQESLKNFFEDICSENKILEGKFDEYKERLESILEEKDNAVKLDLQELKEETKQYNQKSEEYETSTQKTIARQQQLEDLNREFNQAFDKIYNSQENREYLERVTREFEEMVKKEIDDKKTKTQIFKEGYKVSVPGISIEELKSRETTREKSEEGELQNTIQK